jgi:hypothetical protein
MGDEEEKKQRNGEEKKENGSNGKYRYWRDTMVDRE